MEKTIDKVDTKRVLEKLTNGLYIITTRKKGSELETREEDYLAAGTVAWLTQSSFEPAMITVAIQKDSDLAETIAKSYQFAVHILGSDQKQMVQEFGKTSKIDRANQTINGYAFHKGFESDLPILKDNLGYLECELVDLYKNEGDHLLFTGKVIGGELHQKQAQPLHEWRSGTHYGG